MFKADQMQAPALPLSESTPATLAHNWWMSSLLDFLLQSLLLYSFNGQRWLVYVCMFSIECGLHRIAGGVNICPKLPMEFCFDRREIIPKSIDQVSESAPTLAPSEWVSELPFFASFYLPAVPSGAQPLCFLCFCPDWNQVQTCKLHIFLHTVDYFILGSWLYNNGIIQAVETIM